MEVFPQCISYNSFLIWKAKASIAWGDSAANHTISNREGSLSWRSQVLSPRSRHRHV